MKFCDLSKEEQLYLLEELRKRINLSEASIEKDWWVSQVLKALFELPYAKYISFKGGTSLSKAWGLIDRFSEDVDLGIDREFLGYGGELSKTQIADKLRRAACSFVREKLLYSDKLSLEIPADVVNLWHQDYDNMCRTMIYGRTRQTLWTDPLENPIQKPSPTGT